MKPGSVAQQTDCRSAPGGYIQTTAGSGRVCGGPPGSHDLELDYLLLSILWPVQAETVVAAQN